MDIKQINSAIMFGSLTNTDLNSVIDAVKFRRAQMQKTARFTFKPGNSVYFFSTRQGARIAGTITKVALKYATVDTAVGLYRVPMNMLEQG